MVARRVLWTSLVLFFALLAVPGPGQAQAAETPPFVAAATKVYCHAAADSLSVWMNTAEEDGATPYYMYGASAGTLPVVGAGYDPVADEQFTTVIPLTPALSQDVVLDGTISVQAYIGGGTYTAGVASIGTSLLVDGTVVASAAAKNHVMTPSAQAGQVYTAISWTMAVSNVAIPAGSTLEWVISGTTYAANNQYLACHAARGRSHIELPVVAASAAPSGDAFDTDSDGLNDTWEQDQFGNLTAQNGTGDPDMDGLNNSAEQQLGTNATNADTDMDGLLDGEEVEFGTNATNPDTDGDGALDGAEVEAGTDPLDPSSVPVIAPTPTPTPTPPPSPPTQDNTTADTDDAEGIGKYLDSLKGDTGYAGASAAGMGAVTVLSLLGLAVRWGL